MSFQIVGRDTEYEGKSARKLWPWAWCEKVKSVSMKELLPNVNFKDEGKIELLVEKFN